VEDEEELLHSSGGSHSKEHKRRKVESKHESPKSHKKDKSVPSSGGSGEGRVSKSAKRARRSPSLDYEGDSKRSRKEAGATNGSGGGGGGGLEIIKNPDCSHRESGSRKMEKDSSSSSSSAKNRERERIAISGLSASGSRESSPAAMLLSKERKEGKEDRKREHDRLLAIANNDDKRRVIEPLLGDGSGHKKSSKHDKHRK